MEPRWVYARTSVGSMSRNFPAYPDAKAATGPVSEIPDHRNSASPLPCSDEKAHIILR